jgi:hypothetical protein
MERLFSPCTRLYDILESQGRLGEDGWEDFETVKELNLDVSTEELLSAERAFAYADLYAMLGNGETIAWLTPHASVHGKAFIYGRHAAGSARQFRFTADGKEIIALARSPGLLLEICDVVTRLLAVSVVHSMLLESWSSREISLINAPTLAYLMEQCLSLKVLTLTALNMDENHCRVLGTYSRPGLEIELICCKFTSAGTSALTEVLGRNQGPTKLTFCDIDYPVLAGGLRGNSRLKSLRLRTSSNLEVGKRQVLAIAGALKENKGLVDLGFWHGLGMSDETWGAVCDSLKTHPTVEVLNLNLSTAYTDTMTAPAELKAQIQALVNMLKVNLSIHTIPLADRYREHELFRRSVIPYLETNRLRPFVRAIQQTRPIPYRAKVLERALLAIRTDANSFWMLLSGNPEVAFPSTTATTTPAANPPTPTTADTTSTANAAAVAAISPTTGAASTLSVSAVANVATPTACQKRKTCP